ncbi:MAG TPA: multicopper oxidase domain-containing protein, partial [Micromonosporaceae bacterium]|nr:multicopper oxidase domain-containing protein [Micromonosporaceae bacterium]
ALYMINEGPDEPFGGGQAGVDFPAADPATTGQVMKLVVGPLAGPDTSVPPDQLTLPTLPVTGPATATRRLSLNELDSAVLPDVGPRMALLGTLAGEAEPVPLGWGDPVTERPALGATEVWEISNFTADAHPVHLHQVQFQVVGRQAFDGPVRAPEPWESGPKDTVVAFPGETTRVRSRFDLPGRYVWHCHILEHEDHEMMRPFEVVP